MLEGAGDFGQGEPGTMTADASGKPEQQKPADESTPTAAENKKEDANSEAKDESKEEKQSEATAGGGTPQKDLKTATDEG